MKTLISSIVMALLCLNLYAQKDHPKTGKDAYVVNVDARDYTFAMPDEIPSGWITFRFKNKGKDTHVAFIAKKKYDSISSEDFKRAIYDKDQWPEFINVGGPGLHSPGHHSETTLNLEPGDYVIGCGVNTADGIQHIDLGMIRYFKVAEKTSGAPEPQYDGVLELKDYEIVSQPIKKGGNNTLKVIHKDFRDVHLISLDGKSSLEEAFDYFRDLKDPTNAVIMGGAEDTDSLRVTYVNLDIPPGKYAWSSHEYGEFGMYRAFEVSNDEVIELEKRDKPNNEFSVNVQDSKISPIENIKSGRSVFHLEKTDTVNHRVVLIKLKEGLIKKDLKEFLIKVDKYYKKPEEERGDKTWKEHPYNSYPIYLDTNKEVNIELRPGNYVIGCFEGFAKNWHCLNGEVTVFTVPSKGPASTVRPTEKK